MPEVSSRNQVVLQTVRAWAGETIFKRGQDYQRKLRWVRARQGKEAAWRAYVAELRSANRRKRRLVEMLDALAGEAR